MTYAALYAIATTNALGWLASITLGTDKLYDLTGSLSYLLVPLFLSHPISPRPTLLVTLQRIWALRLGTFLFTRVLSAPEKRLAPYLKDPIGLALLFLAQTLWVILGTTPLLVSSRSDFTVSPLALTPYDHTFLVLWWTGFLVQAIADHQKSVHHHHHASLSPSTPTPTPFITTGLWRHVQHPNYAGQVLMAWSLAALSLPPIYASKGPWVTLLVALSPALETLLLTQVMAPGMRKTGVERWGASPQWRAYIASTPLYLPFVGGWGGKA